MCRLRTGIMPGTIKKRALLVGCNYPRFGEQHRLTGCWNDAKCIGDILVRRFDFDPLDICLLVDNPDRFPQPTGAVVQEHLRKLVHDVKARDVLVFYFSGHGIELPPEGMLNEMGGHKYLVMADNNPITDMDFHVLVENLPSDVRFTVIVDSCHSGGLIQHLEEQIGSVPQFQQPLDCNLESFTGRSHTPQLNMDHWQAVTGPCGYSGVHSQDCNVSHLAFAEGNSGNDHVRTSSEPLSVLDKHRLYHHASAQGCHLVKKDLTVDRFIRMLSQGTHRQVKVGNIRAHLYDMFKDEASVMVKNFAKNIFSKLQNDNMWNINGNSAAQFFKQRLKDEGDKYARPAFTKVQYPLDTSAFCDKCVLISACLSYEEAADFNGYGVLTKAIATILRDHPGPVDNFHLVRAVKNWLKKHGYSQHPGLYCSDKMASSEFICY